MADIAEEKENVVLSYDEVSGVDSVNLQINLPILRKEESSDFEKKIDILKKELELANVCNELIKAENPFSVKIDNKELLLEMTEKLKLMLEQDFLNKSGKEDIAKVLPSVASTNIFPQFTIEEEIALKGLANKVMARAPAAIIEKATEKPIEKRSLDLRTGSKIRVFKTSIFKVRGHGTFSKPAGTTFVVTKIVDDKRIKALDDKSGMEGYLNISDIEVAVE